MANPDFPMGFRPYRQINGMNPLTLQTTLSSTNDVIGVWDPIETRSDGTINRAQAGSRTIIGIALQSVAVNTGGPILYCPIVGHEFLCQADEADISAATALFLNYDIVATAPVNGISQMELDSSTGATTASLPLKLVGKADMLANSSVYTNDYGAQVKLIVRFNETAYGAGSVGV